MRTSRRRSPLPVRLSLCLLAPSATKVTNTNVPSFEVALFRVMFFCILHIGEIGPLVVPLGDERHGPGGARG
jgi:hypothetical protein